MQKKKKNPMRGIVREYKGDVIMGFCWYLHFLVGKQSRDPEVPRCGQKADVISPQKSCLQSSGRQIQSSKTTEATAPAQYKRCF